MAARKQQKRATKQGPRAEKDADGLTPYHRRFVDGVLQNMTLLDAAVAAGNKSNNPRDAGWQMMQIPAVKAAVERGRAAISEAANIRATDILLEYKKIGFANMLDLVRMDDNGDAYIDLKSLTRDQAAAIAALEVDEADAAVKDKQGNVIAPRVRRVKIKHHNKLDALHKLGIHIGLFKDDGPSNAPPVTFIIKGDPSVPIDRVNAVDVTPTKDEPRQISGGGLEIRGA